MKLEYPPRETVFDLSRKLRSRLAAQFKQVQQIRNEYRARERRVEVLIEDAQHVARTGTDAQVKAALADLRQLLADFDSGAEVMQRRLLMLPIEDDMHVDDPEFGASRKAPRGSCIDNQNERTNQKSESGPAPTPGERVFGCPAVQRVAPAAPSRPTNNRVVNE